MPYKDPEEKRRKAREYYLRNRREIITRTSKWNRENRNKRAAIIKRHNSKPETKIRKIIWWEQKAYDGNASIIGSKCGKCGMSKERMSIHHIDGNNGKGKKPLNNAPANLVVLCQSCHVKIHNRWGLKEVVPSNV